MKVGAVVRVSGSFFTFVLSAFPADRSIGAEIKGISKRPPPLVQPGGDAVRSESAGTGPVQVDLAVLADLASGKGDRVRLAPTETASFELRMDRRGTMRNGALALSGRLEGIGAGRATLVVVNGALAASIHAPGRGTYEIRPTVDGGHVARKIDTNIQSAIQSACGGAPGVPSTWGSRVTAHAKYGIPSQVPVRAMSLSAGSFGCDDGSVIDLLVVYTQDARSAAGGTAAIEALINLAVADTNDAFANSLINTSVNLVHAAEISYVESGIWTVDGPRLVDPDDGFVDDAHPLRDTYGADCVSLWVDNLDTGGIGYFPDASLKGVGASGMSLLRMDQAALLTMAHEIGHNLFCAHDRPNAPDLPWAEYSYGYREPGDAWRTIMVPVLPGEVIPHFANPNVNWPGPSPPNPGPTGVPVGMTDPSDNGLTINETRLFVANFRPTAVPGLPSVLYVRADALPGGDGTSWGTAFDDLQDGLCKAAGSGGAVQQIWVKAGTYKPDRGSGDRHATFFLVDGVSIYGGFDGTETLLSQRDVAANVTTLSGDIGVDADPSDNCYHVVTGSLNDTTAVLDGFTVADGNADGTDPDDGGAGLIVYNGGTPTIDNCTFTNNTAIRGAGLYCYEGSSPSLTACAFVNNTSTGAGWPDGGGGVHCYSTCSPSFTDCTWSMNTANLGGGFAAFFNCDATFTDCTFSQNTATGANGEGGALYHYSFCDSTLNGCVLEQNDANYGGAIVSFFDCIPRPTSCTFRQNSAVFDGGAMYDWSNCHAELTDCLLAGNTANVGGAVSNLFTSDAQLINCTVVGNSAGLFGGGIYNSDSNPILTNTLLWCNDILAVKDQAAQLTNVNSVPVVNYSSVQGGAAGLGGVGNDGNDPLFVDADGADDVFGTADDDARLGSGSPAIDSGDNGPVATIFDVAGRLRRVDDLLTADSGSGSAPLVDRGAYEFGFAADQDGDGDVDVGDFLTFSNCFNGALRPPTPICANPNADVDGDGDVDIGDFLTFSNCFNGALQPPTCP